MWNSKRFGNNNSFRMGLWFELPFRCIHRESSDDVIHYRYFLEPVRNNVHIIFYYLCEWCESFEHPGKFRYMCGLAPVEYLYYQIIGKKVSEYLRSLVENM